MSSYKVRSRDLVDIVAEINSGKIVLSPFFQRKLVWRLGHKIDFIKTILLEYPFPEIFMSRGSLDVETMQSTSCIVDGQQRLNTIREFLNNKFAVDGVTYSDLSLEQKGAFLKYEVAIIDLDLDQNDPQIIEIFKRLNRTFYALSNIEKMSSEYGSSEFMLIAKAICGELREDETPDGVNIEPSLIKTDPNLTQDFVDWANAQQMGAVRALLLETPIFSKYEISRQVHLMFTLNLMATLLVGIYARNEQVVEHLNLYSESLPDRDDVVARLELAASRFAKLKLSGSTGWYTKSNSFSLLIAIDAIGDGIKKTKPPELRKRLVAFIDNPPADYALAGKEAVNNRRERLLRHRYLLKLMAS